MLTSRMLILIALLVPAIAGCQSAPAERGDAAQAILEQERRALDEWAAGNPLGYLDVDAADVTYFDDIAAQSRVEGVEAMRSYFTSLKGKIPPHKYEIVNPKVQVYGDIGILTLHYNASATDGKPLARWKATSVYRRMGSEWRVVHAHWSLVKPAR
jgi:ketosteroid isomerase-like protein